MGIRHAVPAGLPTGTVAGKVAGDDWRGDHRHIPFEIAMLLAPGGAAGIAGVASAAAGAEMWPGAKVTRSIVDLSQATEFRLTAMVTALGSVATAAIRLGYMTTDAATWAGTDAGASAHSLVVGGGTAGTFRDTGWLSLVAAAQVDNLRVACQVSTAHGATPPSFGSITAFFR